jgi:hypothetical protein
VANRNGGPASLRAEISAARALPHCLTHRIPYDEQTAFPNTA